MNGNLSLGIIKDTKRLRQIFSVLAKYGYGHLIDSLGLRESLFSESAIPEPKSGGAVSKPERLRRSLEELGPTFIKLGQILSTRPELIPPDYAEEFSKLQDCVSPFSFDEARGQVEGELHASIDDIFARFDPLPVASASLAQVHSAELKDGSRVAVKIQRPGIKRVIDADISLMYLMAKLAEGSIAEAAHFSPSKVVREFERAIGRELDFTIEAANAERFRRNFSASAEVYFPAVYGEFSSRSVLTMEFIEGVKITDAPKAGHDPALLARRGLDAVIQMIFRDGFFHADPHPGNVFVTAEGRIVYLDLGLAGRVSEGVREKMLMLLLAIIREDFEEVAESFYKIGIKEREVDMAEFRSDVVDICERHFGKPLKYMELGAFLRDIFSGALRHRIKIPYDYALICKALITMEGVGKGLDPEINIFRESHQRLVEIFKSRFEFSRVSRDIAEGFVKISSFIQDAPPQIKNVLDSLESGKFKVQVEDGSKEAGGGSHSWERIANRLILTLLASLGAILSTALIAFTESGAGTFFGVAGILFAALTGIWIVFSIIKSGKY
ncbi:MAG: ABC1 kinase family protein [Deltaproteobacteria bacterium]